MFIHWTPLEELYVMTLSNFSPQKEGGVDISPSFFFSSFLCVCVVLKLIIVIVIELFESGRGLSNFFQVKGGRKVARLFVVALLLPGHLIPPPPPLFSSHSRSEGGLYQQKLNKKYGIRKVLVMKLQKEKLGSLLFITYLCYKAC